MLPGGNRRYNITYRIVRFDNNEVRWIRAQGTVSLDKKGQVARLRRHSTGGITESKEARKNK